MSISAFDLARQLTEALRHEGQPVDSVWLRTDAATERHIAQAQVGPRHCRVEVSHRHGATHDMIRSWLRAYVAEWARGAVDDLPPRRTDMEPVHAFTAGPLRAAAHCGFYHAIGRDDVAERAWRRAIAESVGLRDPSPTLMLAVSANLAEMVEAIDEGDLARARALAEETGNYLRRCVAPVLEGA